MSSEDNHKHAYEEDNHDADEAEKDVEKSESSAAKDNNDSHGAEKGIDGTEGSNVTRALLTTANTIGGIMSYEDDDEHAYDGDKYDTDGAEEDIDEVEGAAAGGGSSAPRQRKMRKKRAYKKAPDAPRRGRSAYVLFSMDAREQVKASLPPGSKVTEVMKGIAARWRDLSAKEKAQWEEKSLDDKDRYERELSVYEGPLKIANERAKKDPSAPKRAMSAFLHFSQSMRLRLRNTYPDANDMDISKMLGAEWMRMTDEEKRPYQAIAASDSNRYKEAMEVWKRGGKPGV